MLIWRLGSREKVNIRAQENFAVTFVCAQHLTLPRRADPSGSLIPLPERGRRHTSRKARPAGQEDHPCESQRFDEAIRDLMAFRFVGKGGMPQANPLH